MKNSILKLRIDEEEYSKFQEVCEKKGKKMSEVIILKKELNINGKIIF